jgi:hypothetical protein
MKSVTRWFVLPRFGSCKPTPRWGGHKDRVSFNPFPLSNDYLDRVSFSPQSIGTLSSHKDNHTIGVSFFDYKCLGNKKWGRRKAIQATRTQMNTNVSLSQATKSLECVWDLERIWSLLLCLGVKSRALVLNVLAENLDALKCGGWGGIYSPNHQNGHWGRLLSMGAPDSPVRQPRHPTVIDHWSSDMWGHRTVRWCTEQSLFTVQCAFWRLLWLLRT